MKLEEHQGIPRSFLWLMATMAGVTVANLYYNQPLLESIRTELGTTELMANLITVITQIGYALGLFWVIPMGDLYSRKRMIVANMLVAALMSLVIAFSTRIEWVWGASLLLGASSVVPQMFVPIAGQFSRPENKSRNIGYVLSGLLIGILLSRVFSGLLGQLLGWRIVFIIVSVLMTLCCGIALWVMPEMKHNFKGSYASLMRSVVAIFLSHPCIRLNSVRAAFGFGSILTVWACLSFHLAGPPFHAGADKVGLLGLCGVAGALVASGLGKYVERIGVQRFSLAGAGIQMLSWLIAYLFGNTYWGLFLTVILLDIGVQCLQLSNQSASLQEIPEASNRINTIFMTTFFIGGSLGTFLAGQGWQALGWSGVCLVGFSLAFCSLLISVCGRVLSHR